MGACRRVSNLATCKYMFNIMILGPKLGFCGFSGCKPPKITFFEKCIRILFFHIKCHQKITTYLEFEDRPILPLPLLREPLDILI